MRQFALVLLVVASLSAGCRRSRPAPPAQVETSTPAEAQAPVPAGSKPGGTAPVPAAAPVNIPLLETSVEFSDLNGLVAGYYEKHKRLPTVPELMKMYYQPIPIPPGYRLMIDSKSKQVKLVR